GHGKKPSGCHLRQDGRSEPAAGRHARARGSALNGPLRMTTSQAELDHLSVQREVLRLSMRAPVSSLLGQGLISLLMAGYFGYPDHLVAAVFWLTMVFTGQAFRVLLPLQIPA